MAPESRPSSAKYSKFRPAKAVRWMFMAGAYQPEVFISSAILPMLSPKARAMSLLQVAAIITPAGKPTEPTPVKLLLMEAGPSLSLVRTLPMLLTELV